MMEVKAKARLERMIQLLEAMLAHRKANPTTRSEELYYELMIDYWQRVHRAEEEGKYLVAVGTIFPVEILQPFDKVVPFALETYAECSMVLMSDYAEFYAEAAACGLPVEVCSPHRALVGMYSKEVVPRPDFVLWSSMVCDNVSKLGYAPQHYFAVPGFLIDHPYRYTSREVEYYTRELAEGIRFIEQQTHQRMDWERLRGVVELAGQGVQLQREINELRKARPAPLRSRSFLYRMFGDILWAGTPKAVEFYKQVKEEIEEAVKNKKGVVEDEQYRILTLFIPPVYDWRIMDWMEKEYGAVSVIEPYCWWGEGEMDPSKPLESIARKAFYRDVCKQMGGPGEAFLQEVLKLASDYQAEGAIYFAHIGCRHACAMIRSAKDILQQALGIPTLVLDNDYVDPSFASGEELRGKLEGFFEMLESHKGA